MPSEPEEAILTSRDVARQAPASCPDRTLFEASLDPFVIIGPDGTIMDANAAMVQITGAPREQLIGCDFTTWFTEPERARVAWQRIFASGSITAVPLTVRH